MTQRFPVTAILCFRVRYVKYIIRIYILNLTCQSQDDSTHRDKQESPLAPHV